MAYLNGEWVLNNFLWQVPVLRPTGQPEHSTTEDTENAELWFLLCALCVLCGLYSYEDVGAHAQGRAGDEARDNLARQAGQRKLATESTETTESAFALCPL